MFRSYDSGFAITFANGFTVSVQWGNGKNGSPRNYAKTTTDAERPGMIVGMTAEVAIWDNDRTYWTLSENGVFHKADHVTSVTGWQTPEQIAQIVAAVAAQAAS
jgi:hypothetical protein